MYSVSPPHSRKSTASAVVFLILIVALVILSFTMIPAGVLKYRALPELESDVIQARMLLPQVTPLALTVATPPWELVNVAVEELPDRKSSRFFKTAIALCMGTRELVLDKSRIAKIKTLVGEIDDGATGAVEDALA